MQEYPLNEITVTCTGYNKADEVFTVESIDGIIHSNISKEQMLIYPLEKDKAIRSLIGTTLNAVIIGQDDEGNTLLTRRPVMQRRVEELVPIFESGENITGTVYSSSDEALFVDLGERVSGIMYRNDILSSPICGYPNYILPINSNLLCKIIGYDAKTNYFIISQKAAYSNDYSEYNVGDEVTGTVRSFVLQKGIITGYYISITPAIHGIVDVPDNMKFNFGQIITTVVHEVTDNKLRLRLKKGAVKKVHMKIE